MEAGMVEEEEEDWIVGAASDEGELTRGQL